MLIFFEKRIIKRDDKQNYLMRFTFFECNWFSIKLHKFYASDDQCLHDHPWSFISLILWRGYNEWTPAPNTPLDISAYPEFQVKKRIKPLSVIYRPALWVHRVEIEKPAITLVVSFKRIRKWGFWTKTGWIHWKSYSTQEHCR